MAADNEGQRPTRAQYGTTAIYPFALGDPEPRRLNLFLPVLSHKWKYGGISTALRLFHEMAKRFQYARIIVTHEIPSQFEPEHWHSWSIAPEDLTDRTILFVGDHTTPLSLSASDFFLTTSWNSAFFCEYVIAQQMSFFSIPRRHHIYFIQEYEPGYFPWSIDHAYAESTYQHATDTIAVFNSSQLADFFRLEGYRFAESYIYEPMILPSLLKKRAQLQPKERIVFVYARPTVARNGFPAIVAALKLWASRYHDAKNWALISDGDPHPDVDLGNGITLRSRGRLNLEDYAGCLSKCWVGISIIFSPHPGYTVLEMADFGAWTITNRWKNKDPSSIAPNVLTVEPPYSEAIAAQLSSACDKYRECLTSVIPDLKPILRSGGDEFPFIPDLLESWDLSPH